MVESRAEAIDDQVRSMVGEPQSRFQRVKPEGERGRFWLGSR